MNLLASTTLRVNPDGMVTATVGALAFQLSNNVQTRTITVSEVGSASVKTP